MRGSACVVSFAGALASCEPEKDDEPGTQAERCAEHLDRAACEAEPGCQLFPEASELAIVDGECMDVPGDQGWCIPLGDSGGSTAPSAWYELATGRVFAFSWIPPALEGWEMCTCEPPAPAACTCYHSFGGCPVDTDPSSSSG